MQAHPLQLHARFDAGMPAAGLAAGALALPSGVTSSPSSNHRLPLWDFAPHYCPQTKELLEGGTFLQPRLLQGVLDAAAAFVHTCGLARFNRFALPLLAFVQACTGVSSEEFDSMVAAAKLEPVLYAPGCGPSLQGGAGEGGASGGADTASRGEAAGAGLPHIACGGAAGGVAGVQPPGLSAAGARSLRCAAGKVSRLASSNNAAGALSGNGRGGDGAADASSLAKCAGCDGAAGSVHPAVAVAPINAALAAADQQLAGAIASARSALHTAGGTHIPGVAGVACAPAPTSAYPPAGGSGGSAGAAAGDPGACEVVGGGPAADAAAQVEEALPDLGLEADGMALPGRRRSPRVAQDCGWAADRVAATAASRESDGRASSPGAAAAGRSTDSS